MINNGIGGREVLSTIYQHYDKLNSSKKRSLHKQPLTRRKVWQQRAQMNVSFRQNHDKIIR